MISQTWDWPADAQETPALGQPSAPLSLHEPRVAAARSVLDVVRHDPGGSLEQIRIRSGMPRRRFESTLDFLLHDNLVAIHVEGQTKHVLPLVPGIVACARQVMVLRKKGVPMLHEWHHRHGTCTRTDLLAHAQTLAWSERLARDRLRQMLQCSLMHRVAPPIGGDQRVTWFQAVDAKEPVRRVLSMGNPRSRQLQRPRRLD